MGPPAEPGRPGLRVPPWPCAQSLAHTCISSHVWSDTCIKHCVYTGTDWRGVHTSMGPTPRERLSGSPQTLPRSSQPQRLLGRQACSGGALRGLLTTLVFSPQQGFEAAPQASASVCQGCRSRPRASPPIHLTSLSSIVSHGSPGRGGGGGRVGPAVTPLPLVQGPPSQCSTGPSWPWTRTWTSTLW